MRDREEINPVSDSDKHGVDCVSENAALFTFFFPSSPWGGHFWLHFAYKETDILSLERLRKKWLRWYLKLGLW